MDKQSTEKLNVLLQDKVIKRKAMFIPIFCISAFGLVGYAAADREAPVIASNKIQVLYGSSLKASDFEITDNRDDADSLDVKIDKRSFDSKQLGTYTVGVSATDQFNNTSTKDVEVEVVDTEAPVISAKKATGYVIDVEADGSENIEDYVKATDNVDGDVTPFIKADKKLDTKKLGVQTITVTAADNAGNEATQTFQFNVADSEAPKIKLKEGKSVTVDYGSDFSIKDFVKVTDNLSDDKVDVTVDANINTKKTGKTELNVTAADESDNTSKAKLTVNVKDISAPKLTLATSKVKILKGASFKASSYLDSAIDKKDGNVTDEVKVSGKVNTSKPGTYTVKYTVEDEAGNSASKALKVTVFKPKAAVKKVTKTTKSGKKVVSYEETGSTGGSGVVGTARSKIGSRYRSGASGNGAFDCSGFTSYVYAKNGKSLPRTAAAQYGATSRVSSLKAGDLVFFKNTYKKGISHVGVYVGNGQFVHAANSRKGVITSSLSGYWASHYAGGGRK